MIVRELITKLGFDLDEKGAKKADSIFSSLKTAAQGLIAAFAIKKTFDFFSDIVMQTAEAGDGLKRVAEQTGVAAESYQKLAYAADLADVSHENLNIGLVQLSKRVADASEGGKSTSEAFKKVGVNIKNSSGQLKSADEIFLELSDKFQKMPKSIEKTNLSLDLFGKSGATLIPLLNEGSDSIRESGVELEELGGILDKKARDQADDFGDNLTRLRARFGILTRSIGKELIPVINDALKGILGWIRENRKLIGQKVKEWAQDIADGFKAVIKFLGGVVKFISAVIKSVGGLDNALKILGVVLLIFAGNKVVSGVKALATAFQAMGLAIKAGPLGWVLALAAAIYLIVDDIIAWVQGRPNAFGPFYQWVVDTAGKVADVFIGLKDRVVAIWNDLVGAISGIMGGLWDILAGIFTGNWDRIKQGFWELVDGLMNTGKLLWDSWVLGIETATAPFRAFFAILGSIWDKFVDLIGIGDKLQALWQKLIDLKNKLTFWKDEEADAAAAKDQIDKLELAFAKLNENVKLATAIKFNQDYAKRNGVDTSSITAPLEARFNALNGVPPGGAMAGPVTKNQQNAFNIQQKIEVNVDTNADPNELAQTIAKQTNDIMNRAFRGAAQSLETGMK